MYNKSFHGPYGLGTNLLECALDIICYRSGKESELNPLDMTSVQTLETIDAETLKERLTGNEPPILINALSEDSYISKHIPGSINIPVDNADVVKEVIPYLDAEIVVYCANSDCDASPKLAQKLEDMEYKNVTDFEEGLNGWKSAGYRLVGEDA